MKKILIALTLCLSLPCIYSCSDKPQESASSEIAETSSETVSESAPDRTVNDYENGILVGQWKNEQTNIITFNEDGSVDSIMDVSAVIHFTENKTLMLDKNEIASDFINYDGSTLDVSYVNEETGEKIQLLLLERKNKENQDNFNGIYELKGGQLYDSLSANIKTKKSGSSLDLIINDSSCLLYVNNTCSYSQDGDIIDFTGINAPFKTQKHGDCYFVLDGDTLTIINDFDDTKTVFERVKQSMSS